MPKQSAAVAFWESDSLEEHVGLIRRQVRRSMADTELRQLALKVTANKPDDFVERNGQRLAIVTAWGESFRLPTMSICGMKDAVCESQALWDFTVLNVRYILDPDGYDLFATGRYTLLAGAGDCDDMVILLAALHKLVGFSSTIARVVSSDGRFWEHVYLLVGFPKSRPTRWVPLDPTVKGAVPGWEYKKIKATADFEL